MIGGKLMAGYVMTIKKEEGIEIIKRCFETGIYSTELNISNNAWSHSHEGTFADYLSMKKGDNIYFFSDRMIYGIGELIDVGNDKVGYDCKYLNYEDADKPDGGKDKSYDELDALLDGPYSTKNRCFCTFKAAPYFFENGVDMDDVLNSNPNRFKMLRVLWKLSFIKIDDEENKALRDIILKRNEENYLDKKRVIELKENYHDEIRKKIRSVNRFDSHTILDLCSEKKKINHEMAIEAALCELLTHEDHEIFGDKWDYISRQVVASPFKPVDYMDKMDIFGYRYIKNYDAISKYIIIEIKKDKAQSEVIDQIMKYVDWVGREYAHGDYSMIEAYVVAYDFVEEVKEKKEKDATRGYVKGSRPVTSGKWDNVRLVKYSYDSGKLKFQEID